MQGRLRPSDVREILACSGRDPDVALELSFLSSSFCWAAEKHGQVVAIFGVAGACVMSENGSPWMLGSEELDRCGIEIVRVSRYYVTLMKSHFPHLENYVDARQKKSIRWLRWLGFKIEPAKPHGVSGLPFHRFHN